MTPELKLRVEDLFDSLQPEEKQPEDLRIKVEKSERLEELVRGFEEVLKIKVNNSKQGYNDFQKIVQIIPTSKEILEFSILLIEYQDNKIFENRSGLYLSLLINRSNEKEFTINTRHLEKLPNVIGYKNNGKIIRINGDAGWFLGENMQGGVIHVKNTRDAVGFFMQDGEIYVKKTRGFLGDYMQGGTIHVKNAGFNVGHSMHEGTIHIENTYQSLSDEIHGGNIYHQGRLIVKDGVKLI
jgi:hypothetical protein